MAKAPTGWKGQSLRHSNARKYGKAGGKYSGRTINDVHQWAYKSNLEKSNITAIRLTETSGFGNIWYNPRTDRFLTQNTITGSFWEVPKGTLTDREARRIFKEAIKYWKDSDGDGVSDSKDCAPNDPNRQGTNEQVAEAFMDGREDKSGTMFSEGDVVYSYGYHFPIAYRAKDGTIYFNKDGYSNTTARHKYHVRRYINAYKDVGKVKRVVEVSTEELKEAIKEKI